jgi:hypothetical protein
MTMCCRWLTICVGVAAATVWAKPIAHPSAAVPTAVIVELFTSEGCSSCPPADALLERLVREQPIAGARIIALGEHVDYWDQQGWKDRFSSAALTDRQRAYSHAFNLESIYTPQMIVDGAAEIVGSDAAAARRAIGQAASASHGTLHLSIAPASADRVTVTAAVTPPAASGRGDRADVVVAVVEDGLQSDVRRGENQGRVLSHAAVVRRMLVMGDAGAQPLRGDVAIDPGWHREHLTIVAFVQRSRSRRIVAAAAVPLQSPPGE